MVRQLSEAETTAETTSAPDPFSVQFLEHCTSEEQGIIVCFNQLTRKQAGRKGIVWCKNLERNTHPRT